MTELESLLRRYAEGDITQEELQRLATLSHRDEVLAGANARAKTLHRQRVARMSVAASLAMVVALVVIVALRSGVVAGVSDTVQVAEVAPQPAVAAPAETLAAPAREQTPVRHNPRQETVREVAQTVPVDDERMQEMASEVLQDSPAPGTPREETPVTVHDLDGYPVVACNNECSPDSVINDIWRFLRV